MQLIFFLYGIVIGSFYNVVIFRTISNQSVAFPSSHCYSCKHKLGTLDLIPVFSYLFLKGKCRYCKEKISIQYPLVEIACGVVFVMLYNYFQVVSISLILALAFFSVMLIIFMIDLKTMIIPNKFVLIALFIAIAYQLSVYPISTSLIINMAIGGISVSGTLLALYVFGIFILNKEVIGFGDVKLYTAIGVLLGMQYAFLSLFITVLVGGLVATILLVSKSKLIKNREMPLGPFICLATFIVYLYGPMIIDTYLQLVLY